MKISVASVANLSFSSAYTISVIGLNGASTICSVEGDLESFKKANSGKYSEFGVQEQTQKGIIEKLDDAIDIPTAEDVEEKIKNGVMRSVAWSYGLQQGLKLWDASITPFGKIDELPISDYEKACIKKYYDVYQSMVVMPKYIVMLAGVGAAAWAYIAPTVFDLISKFH